MTGRLRLKDEGGRVSRGERGIRRTHLRASEPANARSHAGIRAGEERACARSSRRTPDAMQRSGPGSLTKDDLKAGDSRVAGAGGAKPSDEVTTRVNRRR
jgi:hypothetical protein